jgi:hypothetical protein
MAAGDSSRAEAERVRAKIENLQRYLAAHERGAEGEQRTASALGSLGPDWIQFHDVRWPGRRLANVDHVVVGPGGVFVIDSKNWSGSIAVRDGVLRQNGYNREPAVAGACDAAVAVAELTGHYAPHVHPVLCFVGGQDMRGTAREVLVCSDDNVVDLLRSRPAVFEPAHVLEVANRLDVQLTSATAPGTPRTAPKTGSASSARAASRDRPAGKAERGKRPKSGPRRAVVTLLAGVALLFVGLPVLSAAAPAFGDWFAHSVAAHEDCAKAPERAKQLGQKASADKRHRKATTTRACDGP